MRETSPLEAIQKVESLFASWIGEDEVQLELDPVDTVDSLSFELRVRSVTFLGILRSRSDAAVVSSAIDRLEKLTRPTPPLPLLVVPFMGEVGDQLCRKARVAWIDLSGNARISTEGLHIHVEGKPNQFRRPGRPSNPFAPKSSRITRFLLQHPDEHYSQAALASATNLSPGFTSQIVHRLEQLRLLDRDGGGDVGVRDPDLLLDAWRERYDFLTHRVIKGTVAARTSAGLVEKLGDLFRTVTGHYAATGLAAAWAMTRFANYRVATFFVENPPSAEWKRQIGFREGAKGANVWLAVPKDVGVFEGKSVVDGLLCVHPVQAYLDLLHHPERAAEAAGSIRETLLKWGRS